MRLSQGFKWMSRIGSLSVETGYVNGNDYICKISNISQGTVFLRQGLTDNNL